MGRRRCPHHMRYTLRLGPGISVDRTGVQPFIKLSTHRPIVRCFLKQDDPLRRRAVSDAALGHISAIVAMRGHEFPFAGTLPQRLPLLLKQSSRSEEHTSELQSLMRISYDVFCLQKKKTKQSTCNKN